MKITPIPKISINDKVVLNNRKADKVISKNTEGCQPLRPLEKDTFTKSTDSCQPIKPLTNSQGDKVNFGYKHKLKTAWQKGLLPTVKNGLYGNPLSKSNLSLEHIVPVSQGGKTVLDNLALADVKANTARGITPIKEALSPEQLSNYLEQFKGVKNKYINGDKYIQKMIENAKNKWGDSVILSELNYINKV